MSKMIAGLVLAVATLGAPVLGFAQSNAPLTRAEVRADLVRVEQAGYTTGGTASRTAMHTGANCVGPVSFCNVYFGS